MIPEMNKAGYDRDFNAAVTATAATTGMLIPPSNILIVYAVASGGVSIAALFIAGYIPGILVGLGLIGVCAYYAKKHNFPAGVRVPLRIVLKCTIAAVPSLFLIVVVIGGIIAGIFTATEAGAIAVLYAWILSTFFYREISLSDLREILLKSAETTAIVMFLIGTSIAMSWILAYENIPTTVADFLVNLSDNPIVILLLINLVLLSVGIFMDMTPAVLIFTPIFLPVAVELGMSPLHFGIMMVLNLCKYSFCRLCDRENKYQQDRAPHDSNVRGDARGADTRDLYSRVERGVAEILRTDRVASCGSWKRTAYHQ
jgi:tripartite ATP-independent transporter DctM subunit